MHHRSRFNSFSSVTLFSLAPLFCLTAFISTSLLTTTLQAQSRQYVCAPGLLFCDDFNTPGSDVDRTRWRVPMTAEAYRGRTLFRNDAQTPGDYKLRVQDGMVRLVVSNYNPAGKSQPPKGESPKTEPAKKMEKDAPADDKKTTEKKAMEKTTMDESRMGQPSAFCQAPADDKTKPDSRMRPLEKKTMSANRPFLGTRLIARKAFAPPGAYPFWSAVSISMRARFPGVASSPAGPAYSMMLQNIFPPVGRALPSRDEIDMMFSGADLAMPLEKRVLRMNVQHNVGVLDKREYMSAPAAADFAAWHVYRMDWGPNYITWYVDGKRVKRQRASFVRGAPMYLHLSAFVLDASAKTLEPAPDATGAQGFQMQVDWVRAQKIGTTAILNPTLKGHALDQCFLPGKHCGRMAADYYCQMKGFDQAGDWTLAARKGPTIFGGNAKKCTGDACRGLATVTCFGGMAERDGPMFRKPMTRHAGKSYRLDWCLTYGKKCGRPAADAFCRIRGYARAEGFATERYVSPTHVLDEPTRKICTGRICDGFKYIACGS